MKINRFVALAAIALLIVGGMGTVATHSLAASKTSAPAQSQDCAQQDDDSADAAQAAGAEDTDDIEEQCGDQNEADGPEGAEEANDAAASQDPACAQQDDDSTEVAGTEDTDNVELQCGDQNEADDAEEAEAPDSEASEADEAAALQSKATISAADAEAAALAANPGTSVVQTELDDENGSVVYSVELDNGSDVKVDASNGTILATETGAED